jgi:uncharacterized protein YegL
MTSRRLPVYLLIDTSGSMRGEPIESVNTGLQAMLASLRTDPFALDTVYLSIITFDREVRRVFPLTELEHVQLPHIETPQSGPTHMGKALELLCNDVDANVVRTTAERKGDWMPLLIVMTDGSPSDLDTFYAQLPEIRARNFAQIIACAAGPKARIEYLRQLTDTVVHLDTTDSTTFQQFFKWVSASVSIGNRSMGSTAQAQLPPPPPEVQIVVV